MTDFGEDVLNLVQRHSEILQRIVLYDMGHGRKLGRAVGLVFAEFERFLVDEYGVHLEASTIQQSLVEVLR